MATLSKRTGLGALLVAAWAGLAAAPAVPAEEPSHDEEALAELLDLLDEETDLVTKTRMNSDFVPGIVTVLHGSELEELGARNVWEALSLVPGIHSVRDARGSGLVVVRGLGFPFNNGNVKVLVNSVGVSRESAGINSAILLVPIEQVERIEVIRGPGSVVYGDFAFMGLVNIVTRKEGARVHLAGDDRETVSGGVRYAWSDDDGPLTMSVSAVGSRSDEPYLPEQRSGSEDLLTGVVTAEYRGLSLTVEAVDRRLESSFTDARDELREEEANETSWAVEGRLSHRFNDHLTLATRLDHQDNEILGGNTEFVGHLSRFGSDLQWSGWSRQQWLLGVEYAESDVERFFNRPQLLPPPPQPQPGGGPPPGPGEVRLSDLARRAASAVVQDQIEVTDAVTATLGLRWDDYSDIGHRVTPRFAVVWRLSDRHVLKAQHAEGFRAPTYFELYRSDGSRLRDLDFELNRTTELNYVYKRPRTVARATVFHTELRDMLFRAPDEAVFSNSREAQAEGLELEWRQRLHRNVEVLANASWVDTEDTRFSTQGRREESPNEPDLLANLAVVYRPTPDLSLATRWNHVGERVAGAPGYDHLSLTATWRSLAPGLTLSGGLSDLLDDGATYVTPRPSGVNDVTSFTRRAAWLRVAWSP